MADPIKSAELQALEDALASALDKAMLAYDALSAVGLTCKEGKNPKCIECGIDRLFKQVKAAARGRG
jgi:hypothetical protein